MKKFIKNKFVVLVICVAIVSGVYLILRNAIDNYSFKTNKDIITEIEDEVYEENKDESDAIDSVDGESKKKGEESTENTEGQSAISDEETDLVLDEEILEDGSDIEDDADTQSKIYVYITGEVNVPGVVILNKGSRIVDAINAAGGTTDRANVSKVNLVYILNDGMKVNIPNDNDLKDNPNFEYITMNSGDGGNEDYVSNDNSNSSSHSSNIVNINTATQTELETLPGIGPSLALKIINYRKENGKFSSIEELKEVSGIGESKFEKLKKYVII